MDRLVALREGVGGVVMLVGPAVAALLLSALDGSAALLITAGTSFLAAAVTLFLPRDVGAVAGKRTGASPGAALAYLREGWAVLFHSPFLLCVTVLNLLLFTVLTAVQGLLLPVHFTLLGQEANLGLVLSSLAGGMLIGAGIYAAVGKAIPRRTWFVCGLLGSVIGIAVIGFLPPLPIVVAGAVVLGMSGGVLSTVIGVLMNERIPDHVPRPRDRNAERRPDRGTLDRRARRLRRRRIRLSHNGRNSHRRSLGRHGGRRSPHAAAARPRVDRNPADRRTTHRAEMNTMRSKELAELAGVSVRTLRHYHQIGILPEPDRGPNGYRHYALSHAALLLRIRRLADLGVSLDQMEAANLLEDLDRALETQIEHLRQQRERIAQLRVDQHPPDLPTGMDAFISLGGPGGFDEIADLERDASLVLARLVRDRHEPDVQRLGEAVSRADKFGDLTAIIKRFRLLSPVACDDEVEAVAGDSFTVLGRGLVEFLTSAAGNVLLHHAPGQIPTIDDDPRLNAAQAAALRLVADRLDTTTAVSSPTAGRPTRAE